MSPLEREHESPGRDEALDKSQSPRRLRGWQVPSADGDTGPLAAQMSGANSYGGMFGHSVRGEVTDVTDDRIGEPVVTLRLERHDPHAGRTSVVIVRLIGTEALGFAERGDRVEVTGKQRKAYIAGSRAVNHTTGAIYTRSGVRAAAPLLILLAIALISATVMVLLALHFSGPSHAVLDVPGKAFVLHVSHGVGG